MARSALAQLMRDIEKRIIRRMDAEAKARELIASGDVTAIADMIQENDRLKHVKTDWHKTLKYTMACKCVIARHNLTYELIKETEQQQPPKGAKENTMEKETFNFGKALEHLKEGKNV